MVDSERPAAEHGTSTEHGTSADGGAPTSAPGAASVDADTSNGIGTETDTDTEAAAESEPESEAEVDQHGIPAGLTADYANTEVRTRMLALQDTPDYEHLAAFLMSLREGYLVVDVTGTGKKRAARIRTIRSTQGQLLLPLFTSMDELRAAVPPKKAATAKGAMVPAKEALGMIRSSAFVAAQFDAGSAAFVVLRKFIELALGDEIITAEQLQNG